MPSITENVAEVRSKIAAAATRSGRRAEDVTLVAVSKYVGAAEIAELLAAGCRDLGESRPQTLWEKAAQFTDPAIRWHMIGHLQTNKIERTLPLVSLIHSLDRMQLVNELQKYAQKKNVQIPALVEVNVSQDAAKDGFWPEGFEADFAAIIKQPNLKICGLMCMAGLHSDVPDVRREFASLRELRDRLQKNCPPQVQLDELSMGMSGDYEIAIEEGATIVRVGSALFE